MSNRIIGLVVVVLALGLGAYSTSDTPVAVAASQGGAGGNQGPCDAGKLVGVWTGAHYSMEILSDRTYRASGSPNMASIDVNGTLQVDRCNVKIVDISGRYACPPADIGKYTFTVTNTTLAFAVVSDPCDGRRIPLTREKLTKK